MNGRKGNVIIDPVLIAELCVIREWREGEGREDIDRKWTRERNQSQSAII